MSAYQDTTFYSKVQAQRLWNLGIDSASLYVDSQSLFLSFSLVILSLHIFSNENPNLLFIGYGKNGYTTAKNLQKPTITKHSRTGLPMQPDRFAIAPDRSVDLGHRSTGNPTIPHI